MSKKGGQLSASQISSWLISALVALVALNILLAVIQAYLPLIIALVALVLIARVLWNLTR
jgi:hypothetical protein